MPTPEAPQKKFYTAHKFGKKRKKGPRKLIRASVQPASGQANANEVRHTEPDRVAPTTASTSASTPAASNDRVRIDTPWLSASDIAEKEKKAEEKLQELSSSCATTRKASLVAGADPAAPESAKSFVVVNLDIVNSLLRLAKCKACGGDVELTKGDCEYGLAVKLILGCNICGDVASEWSSPRVDGSNKINPFEINVLAACAMQATGNGQTALNDIFATMNISHRGLHNKTYQRYVKEKMNPATKSAAAKISSECAMSVDTLYKKHLCYGSPSNIAVSYDGSWKRRGHCSHIGVGTVIELFSGFVLDQVVLSNFCLACEQGPKEGTAGYDEWKALHESLRKFQKNTGSKAG